MNKIIIPWKVETVRITFTGGGHSEHVERVKELSRENGRRTIEAIVLSSVDIDSSGNASFNRHKGYHYVALLEGKNQLSFTFKFKNGWRVLSNDCLTFVKDVKTKTAAISLLNTAAKAVNG